MIVENSSSLENRLVSMVSSIDNTNVTSLNMESQNCCEFINGHKPDVLILGVNIATKECLNQLRKTKSSNPTIQIIVLSDNPYEQLKKVCIQAGADYFLDKSSNLEKVIEICSLENIDS